MRQSFHRFTNNLLVLLITAPAGFIAANATYGVLYAKDHKVIMQDFSNPTGNKEMDRLIYEIKTSFEEAQHLSKNTQRKKNGAEAVFAQIVARIDAVERETQFDLPAILNDIRSDSKYYMELIAKNRSELIELYNEMAEILTEKGMQTEITWFNENLRKISKSGLKERFANNETKEQSILPAWTEYHYSGVIEVQNAFRFPLEELYAEPPYIKGLLSMSAAFNKRGNDFLFLYANNSSRKDYLLQAIDDFKNAVKCWPENTASSNNLGYSLAIKGDIVQALDTWEKVMNSNPENIELLYNLTLAYKNIGDKNKWIDHLKQLLEKEPYFTDCLPVEWKEEVSHIISDITRLKKSSKRPVIDCSLHNGQGTNILKPSNELEAKLRSIQSNAECNDKRVLINEWIIKGVDYGIDGSQNGRDSALVYFENVIKACDSLTKIEEMALDSMAIRELSEIKSKAELNIDRIKSYDSRPGICRTLEEIINSKEKFDSGAALVRDLSNRGSFYFRIGEITKSIEIFEKALKIDPQSDEASMVRMNLSEIYHFLGDDFLDSYLKNRSQNSDLLDSAIEAFTKSTQYGGPNTRAAISLGYCYYQKGDMQTAVKAWQNGLKELSNLKKNESFLRQDPDYRTLLKNMVYAYDALEDDRNRTKYLNELINADPEFIDSIPDPWMNCQIKHTITMLKALGAY